MRPGRLARRGPARQRGVSLVEVLSALMVLSLGMLSVAALQIVSKRNNFDAAQRMLATQLAYDLIERMRANTSEPALAAYLEAAAGGIGGGRVDRPAQSCDSAATRCTPAEMARFDLWEWQQRLDGAGETVRDGGGTIRVGGLAHG
jgi:type IV pilus assembly protein PilV